MKLKTLLVASVAVIALLSCSPKASQQAVKLPSIDSVDFAQEASDLKPDPAVVYGKLANGVRYAVLHNETPTKTAALRMRIDTGSLNETDKQRGAAHYLEHMAFNGSKNIPENEMTKILEREGLSFGADTNAYTSFDETVYMLNLPEVSEHLLDQTLMIMRETAENLTLDAGAIDRERGVVQAEKRTRDNPSVRADLAGLEFTTKGSRVMSRMPIGTDETLKNMTDTDLRAYYEAYYRPENTFVVLVGDLDTDLAIAKIKQHFEDWTTAVPAGEEHDAGKTSPRGMDIGYYADPKIQTSISIATIKPYIEKMDTATNRKEAFIAGLGNRILNRRLSTLARKADAEFLGASAGRSYLLETADMMSIDMSSRSKNWQKALAVGEQELRKALKYGFTQAELDEQLANSEKSMEVSVQTFATRRTNGLASGILGSFKGESVYTHPRTSLERFSSYEDEISTDMVWDAFKEQWSALDKPHIYLQTSQEIENPKQVIRTAYEASKAVPVTQNAMQKQDKFAYTDFGTPGKVISQKHIDDIDSDLIKFENNVLVNFKKTNFEKNSIRISISVGDGRLSMPIKDPAMAILANSVMSAGGLKAHSNDELSHIFAGKAVSANFSFGTKSFNISGATVTSDLTDQFNLMMAQLIAPGYRAVSKARYDKYIESWYPTLDSTPGGVASRDVGRLLRSGDIRYGIPPMEDLLAAKIQDVKAWIERELKNGQIEISVVGDIDKDVIIRQVARTFGTLSKRKLGHTDYPNMTKITFPTARSKPVVLTHSGDVNRALLQVYWPAPDGTDIMRNRRLSILRRIFDNRLTKVIREEEGAAYSPFAGRSASRIFKNYGYMSASLGLKPEKISAMSDKLDEIAVDIGAGNISDDEFTRAMEPILEGLDSSLESNSYWMGVISHAQTDSWNIDNFRTREKMYQNMTLADIKPLAKQIYRPETAFRIQILPK
ncbi:MAG: insulinase family protein [Robiginitomaculum sp.]